MSVPRTIQFWLNDRRIETDQVPGTTTLLRYLRDEVHLTGTKEGCAEGDCGACTVALLEDRPGEEPTYRAVNSCLLFLPMLQGKRVYTVEGLRNRQAGREGPEGYHPAQLAMVETRGSQCGYCTPGIVMSLFEATYREDMGASWQVDDQLCGNLCRCTGYRPIRQAGEQVAGLRPDDRFQATRRQYSPKSAALELSARAGLDGEQLYLQPTTLADLLAARNAHPDAVLFAGGTDLGLAVTKHHRHFPVVIGLEGLTELRELERTDTHWRIGAAVNLTRVMETAGQDIPSLHKMLRYFGSRQIRSRATLGGNLANASPIGDTAPVLAALGAAVVLHGSQGERRVPMEAFFTGYRQTAMEGDEIILAIEIPHLGSDAWASSFKVSKRREMDISSVAAGMWVELREGQVHDIRLAYGGMSAKAGARAVHVEAALRGKAWTLENVQAAAEHMAEDFTPMSDQRGSAAYRMAVAKNLLTGFFIESEREDRDAVEPAPVGCARVGGAC